MSAVPYTSGFLFRFAVFINAVIIWQYFNILHCEILENSLLVERNLEIPLLLFRTFILNMTENSIM